jgi:hypothetical protein
VEEVIRRIESCDYFLGIWDPDRPSLSTERGRAAPKSGWRVSAWLPFEYGIAKTARKPTVLAHHNQLDKGVWNRISPEVAQPGYDDNEQSTFEKAALPLIYKHCVQEWIPSQATPRRNGIGETTQVRIESNDFTRADPVTITKPRPHKKRRNIAKNRRTT